MEVVVRLFYERVRGSVELSKEEISQGVLDGQVEKLFGVDGSVCYELKTGSIDWDEIREVVK